MSKTHYPTTEKRRSLVGPFRFGRFSARVVEGLDRKSSRVCVRRYDHTAWRAGLLVICTPLLEGRWVNTTLWNSTSFVERCPKVDGVTQVTCEPVSGHSFVSAHGSHVCTKHLEGGPWHAHQIARCKARRGRGRGGGESWLKA